MRTVRNANVYADEPEVDRREFSNTLEVRMKALSEHLTKSASTITFSMTAALQLRAILLFLAWPHRGFNVQRESGSQCRRDCLARRFVRHSQVGACTGQATMAQVLPYVLDSRSLDCVHRDRVLQNMGVALVIGNAR